MLGKREPSPSARRGKQGEHARTHAATLLANLSGRSRDGGGGGGGEGGERPARPVRGDVGGGGAAPGSDRADQDGALRPEEGCAQGRRGPLGTDHGDRHRRGVPRRPAAQVLLLPPLRRRRRRRPVQLHQGVRVDFFPP